MKSGLLARSLLLFFVLSAGCGSSPSPGALELVLLVDADDALRERLDQVVVESDDGSISFFPGAPNSVERAVSWPFPVTVFADPEGTRGFLRVRGFQGEAELVRRSANLKFERSADGRVFHVYLTSSCVGVFESCDARDEGTCLPCTADCRSASVEVASLPELAGSIDAALTEQAFAGCEVDAGMEAGVPDATTPGNEAGPPGNEAGPPDDAGPPGDASLDGGPFGELTLTLPSVVAAPGCVAVGVTRSDSGSARQVMLSSAGGTFHRDAACTEGMGAVSTLGMGVSSSEVYFAPSLADGVSTANAAINAAFLEGDADTSAPVQIRRRSLAVLRNSDSACALADNQTGSLYCVPSSSPGMVKQFDDLTPYSELSAYYHFSCALVRALADSATGSVLCWGEGRDGQLGNQLTSDSPSPVSPYGLGNQVTQVRAGLNHACAVKQDGSLHCWGSNEAGLIDGSAEERVTVPTLSTHLSAVGETDAVAEVALGILSTCARTVNDEVYCWGSRVGFSATAQKISVPPAKHIAIGTEQACALTADHKLYCWTGTTASQIFSSPDGMVLDRLAMGPMIGCVASERELYCWGPNPRGWLGTGRADPSLSMPTKVALPEGKIDDFAVAGLGVFQGSAIVDGLVYAWGYAFDDYASPKLGIDLGLEPKLALTPNPVFASTKSLSMSPYTSCSIDDAGALACWGSGLQIGNGQTSVEYGAFASKPLAIGSMSSGVTQVETAAQWAVAIKDGKAYSWGGDATGQLGNGLVGFSPFPALIANQSDAVLDVAAAYGKGCALVQSGVNQRQVYCWGGWGDPVFTSPELVMAGDDGLTDVDLQDREGCALDNGTVKCWRDRNFTETARSGMPTNVVKIEMDGDEGDGSYRASLCARTATNAVYCSFGSDPASIAFSNASDLSVGAGHACVITTTGNVQCAGANRSGQVDFNNVSTLAGVTTVPGLSGVTAIQLGSDSSCAKNASGWQCWGSNRINELGLSSIVVSTPTLIEAWQ